MISTFSVPKVVTPTMPSSVVAEPGYGQVAPKPSAANPEARANALLAETFAYPSLENKVRSGCRRRHAASPIPQARTDFADVSTGRLPQPMSEKRESRHKPP